MEDFHISTIVNIMLAIILMVIVPLCHEMKRHDELITNYVEYETGRFVDSVKSSATISNTVYNEYITALAMTGYLYDIEIEHQHKIVAPVYDENGNPTGEYTEYYENVYTEDIIEKIRDTGVYYLAYGDYITVTIASRTSVKSSGLLRNLLGMGGRGDLLSGHIRYIDGGLIWNEAF